MGVATQLVATGTSENRVATSTSTSLALEVVITLASTRRAFEHQRRNRLHGDLQISGELHSFYTYVLSTGYISHQLMAWHLHPML